MCSSDLNASRYNIPPPKLTPSAIDALKNHRFPGNVRELENILERALTLSEGNTIDVDALELTLVIPEKVPGQEVTPETTVTQHEQSIRDWQLTNLTLDDYLKNIEIQIITDALEKNRWNKTATAKQLGMSFRSLRYRLKKLGME